MRVELLTIGSELLLGFTIDTNAAYVARTLADIGVTVVRRTTVGDDAEAIAAAVREALDRTGAVITSGGLGPTGDDVTRPAVATVFGRALRRDEAIVRRLEERFREIGYRQMPQSNLVQAMVPEGARILENRHGTAPGLWLQDERGRWVAMLPGVPRELRGMVHDALVPAIRDRLGPDAPMVLSRTLRTTGIGESALAERLGDVGREVDGLAVAYLPGWEGVDLRLTLVGDRAADARERLGAAIGKLAALAGPYLYGEETADLAEVVLRHCRERGLHLATAESCTGGMLGARVTAVAGASDVYLGGVVAYDDRVKVELLDVDAGMLEAHGAVSEPVARQMAEHAARRLGAEVGVGITGIAGPGGGTPEKPVGTVWIAVHADGETHVLGRVMVGDREEIRRRSTQAALDLVRRRVRAER